MKLDFKTEFRVWHSSIFEYFKYEYRVEYPSISSNSSTSTEFECFTRNSNSILVKFRVPMYECVPIGLLGSYKGSWGSKNIKYKKKCHYFLNLILEFFISYSDRWSNCLHFGMSDRKSQILKLFLRSLAIIPYIFEILWNL